MAKECVFCGRELTLLGGKKYYVGAIAQPVCPDCYEKYEPLDGLERVKAVLRTGRAVNEEKLRERKHDLEEAAEKQQADREEQMEQFREKHPQVGTCPKCGGETYGYGPMQMKLGEETFFFSDINRLASGSLTVKLVRCKACGYTEFYTPNENELL